VRHRKPFNNDSSYDRQYLIISKGKTSSNASSREPSPEKTLANWLAGVQQQQQQELVASSTVAAELAGSSSSSMAAARSSSGPLLLMQGGSGGLRRCDSAQGSLAAKDDVTTDVIAMADQAPEEPAAAAAAAVVAPDVTAMPSANRITSASNVAETSTRSSNSSSRKKKHEKRPETRRDSAAEQFLANIESSINLAAAAPAGPAAEFEPSSSSGQLSGLLPCISSLLGEEGAAVVFLAAAAAAAAPGGPGPAALPAYSSMAAALPASIKVGSVVVCALLLRASLLRAEGFSSSTAGKHQGGLAGRVWVYLLPLHVLLLIKRFSKSLQTSRRACSGS
jgi:hypothetical protein